MADYQGAVAALVEALGDEFVLRDPAVLAAYPLTTFPTDKSVRAVLRPGSVAELQECVRIANRFGTPLYPISTGKNLGYGGRSPTCDQAIIIELGRLDRIRDFSEELAYVTVEPGVSQRRLFEFLQEQNSGLWMDATGGPADHSLIGNIVERGFGHTMMADHFAHIAGMEVVLPNGDLIRTGFGRFPNARATEVFRWGVGPSFDGLFSQSNLGIVTAVTIWLVPAPECYEAFFFSIDEDERLAEIIDLLRPLRLDGTIRSAMHIGNDYKVLSSIARYPWQETGGEAPLPRAVLDRFGRDWDFGAWNGSGAIYGSKAQVKDARRRIQRVLHGHVKKLRFLDAGKLAFAERIQHWYHRLTGTNLPEMLKILKPVFGMIRGEPTDAMLPSIYWRRRDALPRELHPEQDSVGLYWFAPVAPSRGEAARELWEIVRGVFESHGFEPAVSITLINERAIDAVVSISYDRAAPGEDQAAKACGEELAQRLAAAGYYPYRLGTSSMGVMGYASPESARLQRAIKDALDPNGILSPGRYEVRD